MDNGLFTSSTSYQHATTRTLTSKSISSNDYDIDKEVQELPPEGDARNWTVAEVAQWARKSENFSNKMICCLRNEEIDGKVLLSLNENDIRDMRYRLNYDLSFGDLKKLWLSIQELQSRFYAKNITSTNYVGLNSNCFMNGTYLPFLYSNIHGSQLNNTDMTPVHRKNNTNEATSSYRHSDSREVYNTGTVQNTGGCLLFNSDCVTNAAAESDVITPPMSIDGRAANIPPEFFKTFISLGYSFLVTWITSFVMVIVHERVPDMKRYPPLPDIFLDNVPHIPWAFHMCEITGTLLFAIWSCVCIFHKYRMVLLRRFFALAGTVFLLRCVTMLITSLSVPGTHLQCDQSDYAVDDSDLTLTEALELRISRAYTIWSGLGMSIQGVRTCGDYMFSGHTVALTLLNFFITEYTPRNLYFLHTLTWLLNMFGIFFILAAHEHYSIDVFVAFYITSRLFLYYHTLANNQALMSRDSTRTRIWFPMFSYFESSVDGIIPNEFDTVSSLFDGLLRYLIDTKDSVMMTVKRFSIDSQQLTLATKNLRLLPTSKENQHDATSTHTVMTAGTATTTSTNLSTLSPSPAASELQVQSPTEYPNNDRTIATSNEGTVSTEIDTANGNVLNRDFLVNRNLKLNLHSPTHNNNNDTISIISTTSTGIGAVLERCRANEINESVQPNYSNDSPPATEARNTKKFL